MIPLDDRGLTLGDGLFETLLARDGVLVDLAAHLDRLAAGCLVLGLAPPDRARAEALMREAVVAHGVANGEAAVRLTLTAGSGGRGVDRPAAPQGRLFATAARFQKPSGPVRLLTSQVRRNDGSPVSRLKTLAYLDNVLARREAQAAGADEALMLNTRGEVACASVANLFWIIDGRLHTPAGACGILAGVMRSRVIAAAATLSLPVMEGHYAPEALAAADAAFLTNSLIGLRAIRRIDDRSFEESAIVTRLAQAL